MSSWILNYIHSYKCSTHTSKSNFFLYTLQKGSWTKKTNDFYYLGSIILKTAKSSFATSICLQKFEGTTTEFIFCPLPECICMYLIECWEKILLLHMYVSRYIYRVSHMDRVDFKKTTLASFLVSDISPYIFMLETCVHFDIRNK